MPLPPNWVRTDWPSVNLFSNKLPFQPPLPSPLDTPLTADLTLTSIYASPFLSLTSHSAACQSWLTHGDSHGCLCSKGNFTSPPTKPVQPITTMIEPQPHQQKLIFLVSRGCRVWMLPISFFHPLHLQRLEAIPNADCVPTWCQSLATSRLLPTSPPLLLPLIARAEISFPAFYLHTIWTPP